MLAKCQVYILDIRGLTQEHYQILLSYMTGKTLQRIKGFKFHEDKVRCALGEYFIKHTFSQQYGVPYKDVEKTSWEKGKPYLENDLNFHFNISHAGNYVVCAITDIPVGVDVQNIVSIEAGCAGNILSPREFTELELIKPNSFSSYIIQKWTYKESYSKLKGLGLFLPFNKITILPRGIIKENGENEVCFFEEKKIGSNYYLVTSAKREMQIEYRYLADDYIK